MDSISRRETQAMRYLIPALSASLAAALLAVALAAGALPPAAALALLGAASALAGAAALAYLMVYLVRAARSAETRTPGARRGWFLATTALVAAIHAGMSVLLSAAGMAQMDANRDMRALEAIGAVAYFPMNLLWRLGASLGPVPDCLVNALAWGVLMAGLIWSLTARSRRASVQL